MTGYQEIRSQADIDSLLDHMASFHDSMTKEFRVLNRGFVRPDHAMVMGHRFDGQFLIQSQWAPFGIELVFSNILELHLTDAGEYCGAGGRIRHLRRQDYAGAAIELNFAGALQIMAERVFYADRPEWLGRRAFLGPEIPSVDAVPASKLEDLWRQCSACADAWEEHDHIRFSLCPSCGRLTDLSQG